MTDWRERLIGILAETARDGGTVTYRALADRAAVPPPGRIRSVTALLEILIREDHAGGRPLRAAVAISRAKGPLPGSGFFQLCREIGRYFGPDEGPQAALFHAMELRAIHTVSRDQGRAEGETG